jgi:hypothetical protein
MTPVQIHYTPLAAHTCIMFNVDGLDKVSDC